QRGREPVKPDPGDGGDRAGHPGRGGHATGAGGLAAPPQAGMTEAQRLGGGAAAGADGDGAAHPSRPAGEAAPPGEPETGSNSDLADGGDRSAGLRTAAPGDGLATGGAQAPASSAVAVAEAPPRAGTAPAAEEQPAPVSPAPVRQRPGARVSRELPTCITGIPVARQPEPVL